ncbi:MAG: type-F conjugative transfer system pilin assembly protein TrbC [Candidatus Nitrospinota bacterium M3_3B_026]
MFIVAAPGAAGTKDTPTGAARRSAEVFRSEDFREKVKDIQEELRPMISGMETAAAPGTDTGTGKPARTPLLPPSERIYLFISSSMPVETIRGYLADIDRLGPPPNVRVVMRGFIGGIKKIGPTMEYMKKVLAKDRDCDPSAAECELFRTGIQIDPKLFRRYGIEKVPAVVHAAGVKTLQPGMSEGIPEAARVSSAWIVYGDAALPALLEVIRKESGRASLEPVIARLEEGFFDGRTEP